MNVLSIHLDEWQTITPDDDQRLVKFRLSSDSKHHRLAEQLRAAGKLEILELAQGLEIKATSWVGRIDLGTIIITVRPKLSGAPLLDLLRYAYGLRDLHLLSSTRFDQVQAPFQDLLIHQLVEEVSELLARGLQRDYHQRSDELASPRGRINFSEWSRSIGVARPTLPCKYFLRTEATLFNQIIFAGLRFSRHATADLELRGRATRLAQIFEQTVPPLKRLDEQVLRICQANLDRRFSSYKASLALIGLLLWGAGLSLDEPQQQHSTVSAFLFDMNRFFQALIYRFLKENLDGYSTESEFPLRGMFSYDNSHNPLARRSPTPRPDFVIRRQNKILTVLDAKYRDLWERTLPREMLYQLTLYALGHRGSKPQSTIIYPTMNNDARTQIIDFNDLIFGNPKAQVLLLPVNLLAFAKLLTGSDSFEVRRRRAGFARNLAFGSKLPTEEGLLQTRAPQFLKHAGL